MRGAGFCLLGLALCGDIHQVVILVSAAVVEFWEDDVDVSVAVHFVGFSSIKIRTNAGTSLEFERGPWKVVDNGRCQVEVEVGTSIGR